jgi:6-phosphogluconate dehydrogenase
LLEFGESPGETMQIAIIGLGKMGGNMAARLVAKGHTVVGFDPSAETRAKVAALGATVVASLDEVPAALTAAGPGPRAAWVMVPAGDATESVLQALAGEFAAGDILIDGGNANFKDSKRRGETFATAGLRFLDAGTSGGIWGRENGYCLMVGGDKTAFDHLEPLLLDLSPGKEGLGYFGTAGAGHYAKMVHNGIEYAMMQAYAEGFDLLAASDYGYDLAKLGTVWGRGSVVRSWLLDLAVNAFTKDPKLEQVQGWVEDSGEGRWTVEEAIARAVAVPTIAASLFARFSSRKPNAFSNRFLAALRREFGGHAVKPAATEAK